MKRFYAVGLAFAAVFALSAVVVSAAAAEQALWLENGNEITAKPATDSEGLLVLTVDSFVGHVKIDCEGILDGSVGPNGVDEVTAVLTSGGALVSGTALTGTSLDCTVTESTITSLCETGELAEVWGIKLPWVSQLGELTATEPYSDVLSLSTKPSGYTVFCPIKGGEETCEGNPTSQVKNGVGDVTATFANQKPAEDKCAGFGTEGLVEGEGLILLTSGATLSVS